MSTWTIKDTTIPSLRVETAIQAQMETTEAKYFAVPQDPMRLLTLNVDMLRIDPPGPAASYAELSDYTHAEQGITMRFADGFFEWNVYDLEGTTALISERRPLRYGRGQNPKVMQSACWGGHWVSLAGLSDGNYRLELTVDAKRPEFATKLTLPFRLQGSLVTPIQDVTPAQQLKEVANQMDFIAGQTFEPAAGQLQELTEQLRAVAQRL